MPTNDPTFNLTRTMRRPILPVPTDQYYKEHSEGDRFSASPNNLMRIAPYLPYISFDKNQNCHRTCLSGTFMSRDSSGRLIPANGVPSGITEYSGRPFIYSDIDHDGVNTLKNINAATGAYLASGDLNADGVLAVSSTKAGVESMGYAGVKAGRFPIGVLWETALEGMLDIKVRNFDPQPMLTLITQYVLEFGEFAVNQREYADACADALKVIDDLTAGAPGALDPYASHKPTWVGTAGTTDSIQAGDLVAVDDKGYLVRYNNANLSVGAGTAEADLPSATINAIVGRCWGTEDSYNTPLSRIVTSPGARVSGGSNPDTSNRGLEPHLFGSTKRLLVKVELG